MQSSNSNWGSLLTVGAALATSAAYLYAKTRRDSSTSLATLQSYVGEESFKVMQYNNVSCALSDREKKQNFDRNFKHISEEVQSSHPDIFCLSGACDELFCGLFSDLGFKYLISTNS